MTTAMHTLAGPAVGEMLVGAVERVTFHNAETGFCVLRVQVRGRRDLITVVGRAAVITPGERIQATGQCWSTSLQRRRSAAGGNST